MSKMITRPESFSGWLRARTERPVSVMAQGLVNVGMTANGLTLIGFLLACSAALLAAQGALSSAGLVYLLSGPFDALDGAVARVSQRESRFGAALDSILDRYGEALLLGGIGYHFAANDNGTGLALLFAALVGSLMVSYARARSEGLGVENKTGILSRVERMIVLGLALLTTWVAQGLAIIAILAHFTVAQRLWAIKRASGGE